MYICVLVWIVACFYGCVFRALLSTQVNVEKEAFQRELALMRKQQAALSLDLSRSLYFLSRACALSLPLSLSLSHSFSFSLVSLSSLSLGPPYSACLSCCVGVRGNMRGHKQAEMKVDLVNVHVTHTFFFTML